MFLTEIIYFHVKFKKQGLYVNIIKDNSVEYNALYRNLSRLME